MGGEVYNKIITFYLVDFGTALKNIQSTFLQFFATVMPHFVIEYIQDET